MKRFDNGDMPTLTMGGDRALSGLIMADGISFQSSITLPDQVGTTTFTVGTALIGRGSVSTNPVTVGAVTLGAGHRLNLLSTLTIGEAGVVHGRLMQDGGEINLGTEAAPMASVRLGTKVGDTWNIGNAAAIGEIILNGGAFNAVATNFFVGYVAGNDNRYETKGDGRAASAGQVPGSWNLTDLPFGNDALLIPPSGHPAAATRLRASRSIHDASTWFHGAVTTTATDRRGRTYSPGLVSANTPPGALLTPGRRNFPIPGDADADLLPDAWEEEMFGSIEIGAPEADEDEDGMIVIDEFYAGTNPNSGMSVLRLVDVQALMTVNGETNRIVLSWSSVSNRTYTVYRLNPDFSELVPVVSELPGTPPTSVYTNQVIGVDILEGAYRIGVDPSPDWEF